MYMYIVHVHVHCTLYMYMYIVHVHVHCTCTIGNFYDFIFAKVKKRENVIFITHAFCTVHVSVCAKIKSRKHLKLKNFATQTFSVYTV